MQLSSTASPHIIHQLCQWPNRPVLTRLCDLCQLLCDSASKTRKLAEFLSRVVVQSAGAMKTSNTGVDRLVVQGACSTLGWLVKSGGAVTGNIAGSQVCCLL